MGKLINDFEKYLIDAGYKQYTPSGSPSTVYDYKKRIIKVCEAEKISVEQLVNNINEIVVEYDIFGIKEEEGKKSHNAVISALKQFKIFCDKR